jgi:hypothetical protein
MLPLVCANAFCELRAQAVAMAVAWSATADAGFARVRYPTLGVQTN